MKEQIQKEKKESEPIGKPHVITHRGLDPDIPNFFSESSFQAFEYHLKNGYGGIEFDPNPTKDGIIVLHDQNFSRPTNGKDTRLVSEVTTKEAQSVTLPNGTIPTFDDIATLIRTYKTSRINSLHLKSRFQDRSNLERILDALKPYGDIFPQLIIFDVTENSARVIKKHYPNLRLAVSVAHPYDIERYNAVVGGTLMTLDDALRLKSEGLIDGIWGDEWDRTDKKRRKKLYTKEFFEKVHYSGMFAALVTPELHGTSPGLYGGESHQDAKDIKTLMERIREIKDFGADFFCTDHPLAVSKL